MRRLITVCNAVLTLVVMHSGNNNIVTGGEPSSVIARGTVSSMFIKSGSKVASYCTRTLSNSKIFPGKGEGEGGRGHGISTDFYVNLSVNNIRNSSNVIASVLWLCVGVAGPG